MRSSIGSVHRCLCPSSATCSTSSKLASLSVKSIVGSGSVATVLRSVSYVLPKMYDSWNIICACEQHQAYCQTQGGVCVIGGANACVEYTYVSDP
eukprot:3930-Heterococcus_DN1.PRE.1